MINDIKNIARGVAPVIVAVTPVMVFAQTLDAVINDVARILNAIIPVLFILATVVFLWGIIRYITAGGNEDSTKEGKRLMIWGLVGLAVMIAVWGVARAIVGTFGLGGQTIPQGPGN